MSCGALRYALVILANIWAPCMAQISFAPPDLISTMNSTNTAILSSHMWLGTSSAVTAATQGNKTGLPHADGGGERRDRRSPSATTLIDVRAPSAPQKIASAYPPNKREEAARVFAELLGGYGRIEEQFKLKRHDVAGAVAAFLAGSYMAYRSVDFPDENFKPLVQQMQVILGANPSFANATAREKQDLYEQMAILGMFMATTQMALKEKPNAQISANLRQAAKGYLEQFLKTDADKVEITAQGLVIIR